MSRRAQSMPAMIPEKPKRGPIVAFICFAWKVFTCVFSHVALVSIVVAYCIAGALIFEHLEAANEKTVKQGIRGMRSNVTDDLWDMTTTFDYLRQDNWTKWVENRLELFEREILTAMKTKGWDGNENEQQMQWTFFGALFYSIIVITTIGYGHIAPKTDMGKVITIFYAILGIPLMLLCLSNIGDVMASSFRFLYWRVCCFVCTREPKRPRRPQKNRMNMRPPPTRTRSQPPPNMRRSMRISQKSTDSGFITRSEYEQNLVHSSSDPQLRYNAARSSDRQRSHRGRGDYRFDVYDERSRYRHDRDQDRNSPYNSGRTPPRYDDCDDDYNERDDGYNKRSRSSNHLRDRRSDRDRGSDRDRRNDRGRGGYDRDRGGDFDQGDDRGRDRSPEDNWDDRDRGRNSDRGRQDRRKRPNDYDDPHLDPYNDPDEPPRSPRASDRAQRYSNREQTRERLRDRHTVERERNIKDPDRLDPLADFDEPPSPRRSQSVRSVRAQSTTRELSRGNPKAATTGGRFKGGGKNPSPKSRAKSMDPRGVRQSVEPDEYGIVENRYAVLTDTGEPKGGSLRAKQHQPLKQNRSHSLPRNNQSSRNGDRDVDRLEVPETPMTGRRRSTDRNFEDDYDDDYRMLGGRGGDRGDGYYSQSAPPIRRGKQVLPPSPRIMSPMGFAVHRQAKYTKPPPMDDDYDAYFDEEWDSYTDIAAKNRPVPIWLCVFLVVGYIVAGAFLFSEWERWSFLDSAYFCFITLTTIGFGDFVPAQGVKENSEISIALCSLYLLFGISLLAMSFNLVQEEVIANVKSVARRLGILKEPEVET